MALVLEICLPYLLVTEQLKVRQACTQSAVHTPELSSDQFLLSLLSLSVLGDFTRNSLLLPCIRLPFITSWAWGHMLCSQ